MSRLYPTDSTPRTGYQRTPRVPGPFASEERPIRYRIIWYMIGGTGVWLLFADTVSGWLS